MRLKKNQLIIGTTVLLQTLVYSSDAYARVRFRGGSMAPDWLMIFVGLCGALIGVYGCVISFTSFAKSENCPDWLRIGDEFHPGWSDKIVALLAIPGGLFLIYVGLGF